jgi:hypothetical protein
MPSQNYSSIDGSGNSDFRARCTSTLIDPEVENVPGNSSIISFQSNLKNKKKERDGNNNVSRRTKKKKNQI